MNENKIKKYVKFKLKLPTEILELIANYLEYIDDVYNFYLIDSRLKYKLDKLKYNMAKNIFSPIIDIFGGLDIFCNYDYIPFKWTYCEIDYIDNISLEDLPKIRNKSKNVYFGEDMYSRKFITIKFKEQGEEKVVTIFERYRYDYSTWTSGSKYYTDLQSYGYFYNRGFPQESTFLDKIKKLVKNNFVL